MGEDINKREQLSERSWKTTTVSEADSNLVYSADPREPSGMYRCCSVLDTGELRKSGDKARCSVGHQRFIRNQRKAPHLQKGLS